MNLEAEVGFKWDGVTAACMGPMCQAECVSHVFMTNTSLLDVFPEARAHTQWVSLEK